MTGNFAESEDGVRKIMLDLFGSPDTAELFFTNDVKVLLEVLHRNVIDRGEGDTVSFSCFSSYRVVFSGRSQKFVKSAIDQ